MPLVLTDINSPLLTDSQSSFIGGQFSNAAPLQLDETACTLLEDAETITTGQAESRRGTVQLGGAVGASGTISALDYYLTFPVAFLAAGGAYWLNGSAWQLLSTGTPPTGVVSTAVGNGFLYAVTGAGSIYKLNGSSWSTLSTDSPPSNCSILLWDGFRLIASGQTTATDALYFSGILNDALWAGVPGGYQIQVGGGDGAPITAVVAWNVTNLAVFKSNQIWVVGADPQLNVSDMPVQRVHRRIGCIAKNSAVQVGADIFFLSSDGVRSLQQTVASDNQYELGTPLSFPIQDVIDRINPSVAYKASAIFWKGRYLLSVALDGATTNNYILVYNTITSKWTGGWTNLPVSCFGVRTDSKIDKLILGLSSANNVIEFLDYVAEADANDTTYSDYNGAFVPFRFITRGMIFGDLDSPKKGFHMRMKSYKSKGQLSVTALFNEGDTSATKTFDAGSPNSLLFPITFPGVFPKLGLKAATMSLMPYPRFHQVQFEVKAVSAGRKEVRALSARAFPEALDFHSELTT